MISWMIIVQSSYLLSSFLLYLLSLYKAFYQPFLEYSKSKFQSKTNVQSYDSKERLLDKLKKLLRFHHISEFYGFVLLFEVKRW